MSTEDKDKLAAADLVITVDRFRGIATSSKQFQYAQPADSMDDDVKNIYKDEVRSKEPKYEVSILYVSKKGSLRLKTFKCGSRGSVDSLSLAGDLVAEKRKKFGGILVDHADFDVQNVNKTGGILNPKFWEKNLDWQEGDKTSFMDRLYRIDRLLQTLTKTE